MEDQYKILQNLMIDVLVGNFNDIPVKEVFKTFKEINQLELVNQAGIRQQYIDQSVSLNLAFPSEATPKWINTVHHRRLGKTELRLYIIQEQKAF
jgi:ribonucleotide reductase alpha subunit